MAYTKYGLYADPSFQLGMALGDAYGNLWASNAKKRNEAQMDEVVKQYMDDQRMQQLANPIEEKPLMTEAINGNYTSDNTNSINNNISGISKFNRSYGLATPQNIIDEAKRRGIHQEVIDERMKGVREQIASKAKSQYMPQINQLIYGSMDVNGNYVAPTQADYLKASGLIDDYRKYDTVGADKLTETLNNRQLGQLQHLASRQQAIDDYRFRQANGMVEGRPQYQISDAMYNSLLKEEEMIMLSDLPENEKKARLNDIRGRIAYAKGERGGFVNNQETQSNVENKQSQATPEIDIKGLKSGIKKDLENGKTIEQLLEEVKTQRGESSPEYKATLEVADEIQKEKQHKANVDKRNADLVEFLKKVRALGIESDLRGMPYPKTSAQREAMRKLEEEYGFNYTDIPLLGYKY